MSQYPPPWPPEPPQKHRVADAFIIGLVVFIVLHIAVDIVVIARIAGGDTSTSVSMNATVQTTQPTQPTTQPTVAPTAQQPTPTPVPTHKPIAQIQPTQAPPQPTQPPPIPTQPACQAVNNNPWCYNFSPGTLISVPPSGFCSYFNCIASFVEPDDPGDGYVVECQDSTFSQSGSERGACSYHGGVLRPLYAH